MQTTVKCRYIPTFGITPRFANPEKINELRFLYKILVCKTSMDCAAQLDARPISKLLEEV